MVICSGGGRFRTYRGSQNLSEVTLTQELFLKSARAQPPANHFHDRNRIVSTHDERLRLACQALKSLIARKYWDVRLLQEEEEEDLHHSSHIRLIRR
jgi:hypothetical protein